MTGYSIISPLGDPIDSNGRTLVSIFFSSSFSSSSFGLESRRSGDTLSELDEAARHCEQFGSEQDEPEPELLELESESELTDFSSSEGKERRRGVLHLT